MGNSPYSSLILIALMVVAFYLLILRPQRKRQRAQLETMSSLTPGTRVLLGSGIFGTLVSIGEKQAVIELSTGANLTVLKQAIVRTVRDGDEDTEWISFEDEDDDEAEVIEPHGVDSSTVEVRSEKPAPTFDAPSGSTVHDPDPGPSSSNRG